MPAYGPPKRKLEDFDPNASDPNDSDFEETSHSAPRSNRRRSQKHSKSSSSRPAAKKQRRRRGSDSDDIVDDEEEISQESFSESSSEEEPEINPATGRAVRTATKKQITYEESDVDEDLIEDSAAEADELSNTPKATGRNRKRLVIKLPFTNYKALNLRNKARGAEDANSREGSSPMTRKSTRNTRSRTHSKPPITPVMGTGTRKSSRLSRDPSKPPPETMELSASGRHAQVSSRPATSSPDQGIVNRRTRGAKGPRPGSAGKQPPKVPSAILEESTRTETDVDEVEVDAEAEVEDDEGQGVVESVELDDEAGDTVMEEDDEPEPAQARDSRSASSEGPVRRSGRNLRSRVSATQPSQGKKRAIDESSDYNPEQEAVVDENFSDSDNNTKRLRRQTTSSQPQGRKTRSHRELSDEVSQDEIDEDELAEEAHELQKSKSRQTRQSRRVDEIIYENNPRLRRRTGGVNYKIATLNEVFVQDEEGVQAEESPAKRGTGSRWRPLWDTKGPFGGNHLPDAVFGGPPGEDTLGIDSDSSDDEGLRRPPGVGGPVGMTPISARGQGFPATGKQGGRDDGPADFGRVTKEKKALADADPLGVDENINFDAVGGLDDHINSLKEMVMLPLLYPEVFAQFKITPPRGVLFHGPPGTGKTLLARALANSVSVGGKKVTFFIRKGADALSKWVGEAERQLRMLFEEARKCQPSIIFFDEIDGLAPVRSSKQDQLHASIVATLLALMDGMDGRGQVIIIGATNRPDNVDPALRRPGRFDREFYFPLPDVKARRAIIEINTKSWDPPLSSEFTTQLAEVTNGYGGADLRALCTEAALNAVQGTYPQIYKSDKKLLVDPTNIKVLAKDFMLSVNKIIPSSERSTTSKVEPLHKDVEPLLRKPLEQISKIIDDIMPIRAKLTALEEAQFDDRDEGLGFQRETLQRDLDRARIFRPRLLIRGVRGMGQNHIASALLHKFEKLFVQSFALETLQGESDRSIESAIVMLFKEVRRHKPSVILLPAVDVWYESVGHHAIKIFVSLLRGIQPNEPVLVLGTVESDRADAKVDPAMMRDLFGFSSGNDYVIERPDEQSRYEFFEALVGYIKKRPSEFPDPENRKRRKIDVLEEAPTVPEAPKVLNKEDLKKQKKQDRHTLNQLKQHINPVMEQIKKNYRKFTKPAVPDSFIEYLHEERNPENLISDLTEEQRLFQEQYRPYVMDKDRHNVPGLREVATGKFYYNIEIIMIEQRLSNGYYKRWKDFLADLKRMAKDIATKGERESVIKANDLITNVEVDMATFETNHPYLVSECEAVYLREKARAETVQKGAQTGQGFAATRLGAAPVPQSITTTETSGPIVLGEPVPGPPELFPPVTPLRQHLLSNGDSTEPQTNGSTAATDGSKDDVHMTGTDNIPPANSAFLPSTIAHSGSNTQQMRNQRSALEKMAPGSQVEDYHNSASTTTSGQKTTSSNRTSGHSNAQGGNTQSSNGTESRQFPNFSAYAGVSGGDQFPDTQENSERTGTNQQSSADSGREVYGMLCLILFLLRTCR
jgi:SpoVK/Ycf46/Vps4 family AAA+-type ATPase